MARKIGAIDADLVGRYADYWDTITPKTLEGRWQRWVYALLSGHTGWQQNSKSFSAVMSQPWETKAELKSILRKTRCGLYEAKAEGVWQMTMLYRSGEVGERILAHPDEAGWAKAGWPAWRDRLVSINTTKSKKVLPYAGPKIISFAHEMCWPRTCGVLAVDTHVAQWYGVEAAKLSPTKYAEIENHWLKTCQRHDYPAPLVRHILWDQEQGFESTSYWSYVFEEDQRNGYSSPKRNLAWTEKERGPQPDFGHQRSTA